jgi:ABC-type nickel/cobalt efflux system permease component RcnA
MGNLLTFVHVFSAVCVILVVHFVLNTTGMRSFEAISSNLESISYSMLILIGLILLGRYLYELKHGHTHGEKELQQDEYNLKHLMFTAFVTGLVPCPGAALILIFTLSQEILLAGVVAMFCVAFGMGLTTAIFALLAIASRHSLLHLMDRHQKLFAFSHAFLSISGALIITCIGGLLLFGRG